MQILISTTNGKTITLEVDPDESVHQIKQKIHSLEGIPFDQQKLVCDGKLLEDIQTLAEYIEKDYLITLKVNEIKLQIKAIGEANFLVEAEPTETIQIVKKRIAELKNISPEDLTLSFKGKKLEDNITVAAANLKDKSLLLLKKTSVSKPSLSQPVLTPSAPPKYCLNNCGFYGNPATNDYCSKCFKDLNPVVPPVETPSNNNNNNNNIDQSENIIKVEEISSNIIIDNTALQQVDTSKCWKCTKKIGIYGFQCRCKYFFCEKHRYNDLHDCTFDYNEFQKANLTVKLEKVVERKLHEI